MNRLSRQEIECKKKCKRGEEKRVRIRKEHEEEKQNEKIRKERESR